MNFAVQRVRNACDIMSPRRRIRYECRLYGRAKASNISWQRRSDILPHGTSALPFVLSELLWRAKMWLCILTTGYLILSLNLFTLSRCGSTCEGQRVVNAVFLSKEDPIASINVNANLVDDEHDVRN